MYAYGVYIKCTASKGLDGQWEPSPCQEGLQLLPASILWTWALLCRTLVRLYPISPAMADQWLVREIFRGACDPGALAVFR